MAKLLDLFCGAGGASYGYHLAGFDVTGVDICDQPEYPFKFICADALTVELSGYDVIAASPPCQAHTMMKHVAWNYGEHKDFIPEVRDRLKTWAANTGGIYIIENVVGAPLEAPVRLCGTSFGLGVEVDGEGWYDLRRHRLFESNVGLSGSICNHKRKKVIGVYGDHLWKDRRHQFIEREIAGTIGLYGEVCHKGIRKNFSRSIKTEIGRIAMGMPWVNDWYALKEAIPPAYTEYLGKQLWKYL